MALKGTKTEANLQTAFAGESQARGKYHYYAAKAREEGYGAVARVFDENAVNEQEHAKLWFKYLDGINDTASNLKAAAEAEKYEWSDMYVNFAKTAKEEGFGEIAERFEKVGAIEKGHEAQYNKLLATLKKDVAADSSTWRCVNCGNIVKAKYGPGTCPVCAHADVPWSGSKAYVKVED
jgi:rubrerythrin